MGYIKKLIYLKALLKQDMVFHRDYLLPHVLILRRIQYLYLNRCLLAFEDLYMLTCTLKMKSKTAEI